MKKNKSKRDDEQSSALQLLAFLVVECNVGLPYEKVLELDYADPLFIALTEAWHNRVRRENEGQAFLASCIFNAAGKRWDHEFTSRDFLQPTAKDKLEEDAQLKARLEMMFPRPPKPQT